MSITPTGTIELIGLRIFAHHGVDPQETKIGNDFEVTVRLRFDPEAPMRTDRLDLTLNYAELTQIVETEMAFPSKLLENVAFRIYQNINHRYPHITGGSISIYKLHPPVRTQMQKAGFTFEW